MFYLSTRMDFLKSAIIKRQVALVFHWIGRPHQPPMVSNASTAESPETTHQVLPSSTGKSLTSGQPSEPIQHYTTQHHHPLPLLVFLKHTLPHCALGLLESTSPHMVFPPPRIPEPKPVTSNPNPKALARSARSARAPSVALQQRRVVVQHRCAQRLAEAIHEAQLLHGDVQRQLLRGVLRPGRAPGGSGALGRPKC